MHPPRRGVSADQAEALQLAVSTALFVTHRHAIAAPRSISMRISACPCLK